MLKGGRHGARGGLTRTGGAPSSGAADTWSAGSGRRASRPLRSTRGSHSPLAPATFGRRARACERRCVCMGAACESSLCEGRRASAASVHGPHTTLQARTHRRPPWGEWPPTPHAAPRAATAGGTAAPPPRRASRT
eukprot:3740736-Prymnesium_polylepis.1